MWSTIAMFVLTFAVLGLLLGIAETFDTRNEPESNVPSGQEATDGGNSTAAASETIGIPSVVQSG